MCPGVTSAGGKVDETAEVGKPVAIYCEGKEHALAVGKLLMSPEEIKTNNTGKFIYLFIFFIYDYLIYKYNNLTGHCIETYHVLNDGLWGLKDISKKKWTWIYIL